MKIQLAENLGLLKNITMYTLYQETRPDFDILGFGEKIIEVGNRCCSLVITVVP